VNIIWSRGNHLYHQKWGGWRIFNKGHLMTPVFNDRGTLVGEMIK
jgi:hypothetical protein